MGTPYASVISRDNPSGEGVGVDGMGVEELGSVDIRVLVGIWGVDVSG
jgi:hypothetical protein